MQLNWTVIGGGSVNWMYGIMRDIYRMDEIEGGRIRLVDPNTEHVEAVAALLREFNRQRGRNYEISVVADRREALRDANFVVATFSPGAMDAFRRDLEIPIRYGIRLPVSMTVGPGGISSAMRAIPVAHEIVQDMEQVCPGAWLLNETNPMTTVTRAMNMAARTVRVVGLCHGLHHHLAVVLGPTLGLARPEGMTTPRYIYEWLPQQGFEFSIGGVNHFIFLVKARLKGEDVLPRIRRYCAEHVAEQMEANCFQQFNSPKVRIPNHAAAMAICRQVGYLPINHDRHVMEFLPGVCNAQNGFGIKYGTNKTTVDERLLTKARQLERIRKAARGEEKVSWPETNDWWDLMGEGFIPLVRALLGGPAVTTVVNLPNRGQLANLPADAVVETLGRVTARGIDPDPVGDLPRPLAAWCRLHVEVQELTVRAALEGSREFMIEALTLDPLCGIADLSAIPAMADELLEANRQWLPRFYPKG